LKDQPDHIATRRALNWLQINLERCLSPYSIAWAALALAVHEPHRIASCIELLTRAVVSRPSSLSIDTLSVAAIALGIGEGDPHPFHTVLR
jgi:hypothetical protein